MSNHQVPIFDDEGNTKDKVWIFAEKYFLQNTGRAPATDVEFVVSGNLPSDISVWQPRHYKKQVSPDGNLVVTVPFVAPSELVVIDCVYINSESGIISSVKCKEVLGKEVTFWTLRKYSPIFNYSVLALVLLGLVFLFSSAFNLVLI